MSQQYNYILKRPRPNFGIYWPVEIYKQFENKKWPLLQPTNLIKSGSRQMRILRNPQRTYHTWSVYRASALCVLKYDWWRFPSDETLSRLKLLIVKTDIWKQQCRHNLTFLKKGSDEKYTQTQTTKALKKIIGLIFVLDFNRSGIFHYRFKFVRQKAAVVIKIHLLTKTVNTLRRKIKCDRFKIFIDEILNLSHLFPSPS